MCGWVGGWVGGASSSGESSAGLVCLVCLLPQSSMQCRDCMLLYQGMPCCGHAGVSRQCSKACGTRRARTCQQLPTCCLRLLCRLLLARGQRHLQRNTGVSKAVAQWDTCTHAHSAPMTRSQP